MSESNGSQHDRSTGVYTDTSNKLGKRMTYFLRYGAEKEGLKVSPGGYVELEDLLKVPLMKHYTRREVIREVETSVTPLGNKRFEMKLEHGNTYIRALYGRRMERNPNHEGTNIPRLMECCITLICNNIRDYDFQEFPDEFLVTTLIHRLRTTHRLNNKAFNSLLGPHLENLDLGGVMITPATMRLVGQRCTSLRQLNLRESSYILNDHILEMLLKKLPKLESLNLSGCSHLGDRSINAIAKHCPDIQKLNLSHIPNISQDAVLKLATTCSSLQHLDMFDNKNITERGREVLEEVSSQTQMVIVLEGLAMEAKSNSVQDDSTSLKLASVGKLW